MKFAPRGLLALSASAYGQDFPVLPSQAPTTSGPIAVVSVRGPLTHHPEAFVSHGVLDCFDSYDAIKSRISQALTSEAATVVLALDSPGGEVSGLFSLVSEVRALAARTSKQLVAHVSGAACSAAYALACAASSIVAAPGATLGSIGVIEALVDQSALDKAMGLHWSIISSGARKADGNPHAAVTPEALAARQAIVTETAESFFALVGSARGLDPSTVRSFEAGLFSSERALASGLIDQVSTLDDLLLTLTAPTYAPQGQNPSGERQLMTYTDAIDALRSAAEGDDEEATKARKMLKALEGDDSEEKDEPKAESDSDDEDEAPKAESEDEEPKKDEAKAQALSIAKIESLVDRKLRAQADASERSALLASRKDLDTKALAALASVPTAQLKDLLSSIPKAPASPVAAARAALGVTGTRGGVATGKAEATRLSEHADLLDRQMGLAAVAGGAQVDGDRLILSAVRRKEAK